MAGAVEDNGYLAYATDSYSTRAIPRFSRHEHEHDSSHANAIACAVTAATMTLPINHTQ